MTDPIPAPPTLEISRWSQTRRFIADPILFLHRTWEELGDLFCIRFVGLGDWVFVCSPELNQEMFKTDEEHLAGGMANRRFIGEMMGPNATFSLDGEEHDLRRRLVLPHLSGKRLLARIPEIREITRRSIEAWPHDEPFPAMQATNRLTLEIIIESVFGELADGPRAELTRRAQIYFEQGLRSPLLFFPKLQWNLGPWSPWGKVLRQRDALFTWVRREVDERLAGRETHREGVLEVLIGEPMRDGSRLTRDAIVDEAVNLLFGAQESTGKILAWTLLSVLANPGVEKRLREEIDEVLGEEPIGEEHVPRLEYLDAVIQEGMRCPPASPFAGVRIAREATPLGDYLVPKGSVVTQGYGVMTQRDDLYESPGRFDPDEHFHQRRIKPYTFSPFGGGKRMCIGKSFAQLELKVILATLFQIVDCEPAFDELRGERQGFLVQPENGGPIRVRPRAAG